MAPCLFPLPALTDIIKVPTELPAGSHRCPLPASTPLLEVLKHTTGLLMHRVSLQLCSFLWLASNQISLASHLILCRPLLLLPPIPPSIRVFSNESTLRMRWPKYWSFSFSISLSREYSGLISLRMDWLDLLVQNHFQKCILVGDTDK